MARQPKEKAFHSPFAKLRAHTEALAQKQADVAARKAAQAKAQNQARAEAQTTLNDAETFLRAVSGATPLRPSVPREPPSPTVERVRVSEDDLALAELQGLVSGHGTFRVNESEEMLFGLAPGVNLQLLEQLQEGHFAYHRHIDLHGLQRDEAHLVVNKFIAQPEETLSGVCLSSQGRGKKSPGGMPVLRASLPRWLSRAPNRPHVLAFCTAQSVDGGSGAFYVLLRRPGIKPYGESLTVRLAELWSAWRGPLCVGLGLTEVVTRFGITRFLTREFLRAFVVLDLRAMRLLQQIVKPRYELRGACQQRGACCTQIVGNPPSFMRRRPKWLATFAWFHRVLHNFHVVGQGDGGELIFKCGYLKQDGGCGIYRYRPRLCRVYPLLPFFAPPKLLPGCGYRTAVRGLKQHPRLPVLGQGHVGVHHPTPMPHEAGVLEHAEDFVLVDTHQGQQAPRPPRHKASGPPRRCPPRKADSARGLDAVRVEFAQGRC